MTITKVEKPIPLYVGNSYLSFNSLIKRCCTKMKIQYVDLTDNGDGMSVISVKLLPFSYIIL